MRRSRPRTIRYCLGRAVWVQGTCPVAPAAIASHVRDWSAAQPLFGAKRGAFAESLRWFVSLCGHPEPRVSERLMALAGQGNRVKFRQSISAIRQPNYFCRINSADFLGCGPLGFVAPASFTQLATVWRTIPCSFAHAPQGARARLPESRGG